VNAHDKAYDEAPDMGKPGCRAFIMDTQIAIGALDAEPDQDKDY
jgi:hypothetical protein